MTTGWAIFYFATCCALLVIHYLAVARLEERKFEAANVAWSAGDIAVMRRGSSSEAATIPALRGIPNVTVSYYDIDATDPTGIRWALWESAIHIDGRRTNALSTWRYDWTWDAAPDGSCGAANAQVSFKAHVTLPRMVRPNSLNPDVARQWQHFIAWQIQHEANHVRHAYEGRSRVAQAVRTSDCRNADWAGQWAIDQISRQEADYDLRVKGDAPVFGRGWRGPRDGWVGPSDS